MATLNEDTRLEVANGATWRAVCGAARANGTLVVGCVGSVAADVGAVGDDVAAAAAAAGVGADAADAADVGVGVAGVGVGVGVAAAASAADFQQTAYKSSCLDLQCYCCYCYPHQRHQCSALYSGTLPTVWEIVLYAWTS